MAAAVETTTFAMKKVPRRNAAGTDPPFGIHPRFLKRTADNLKFGNSSFFTCS
jgi:hypothetical protein